MKELLDFSELKDKITVETTGDFKNIELTDDQYKRLITLMKIGLRVVGSYKGDINVPLIDIDQYISSYAEQFNANNLVELSDLFGIYLCTESLSIEMEKIYERYGVDYVYHELSHKLALRDLFRNIHNDPSKNTEEIFNELKSGYINEFDENSIYNLIILDKNSNLITNRTNICIEKLANNKLNPVKN